MPTERMNEIAGPMATLNLLPIFYLFPQELLDSSEFAHFPRNPYFVYGSAKWRAVYNSDKFLETVIDGTANMVWKHFGIKAPMESFSGYYPFWKLAHTGIWWQECRQFAAYYFRNVLGNCIFAYPVLPFETSEFIFRHLVERLRPKLRIDECRAVVKALPVHEDYEPSRWSKGRIDFYRKWNHSRSATKMQFMGTDEKWDRLEKTLFDPWGNTDFGLDYEDFKDTLLEKDRQIIEMLYAGYTQVQIAQALGYANHSAVCKRAAKIAKKYREYSKINDKKLNGVPTVKNNWDEMTRLLFPPAKRPSSPAR